MTWVKLDDGFARNAKFRKAGPAAGYLCLISWAHCSEQLNDGVFPSADIPMLAMTAAVDPSCEGRLREAGLWHGHGDYCEKCTPADEGYIVVHDYLAYNPTRADTLAKREQASKAATIGHAKRRAERRADSTTERTADSLLPPSRPVPNESSPPPPSSESRAAQIIRKAVEAEVRKEAEAPGSGIRSVRGVARSRLREALEEHEAKVARWLDEFDRPDTEIVKHALASAPASWNHYRRNGSTGGDTRDV